MFKVLFGILVALGNLSLAHQAARQEENAQEEIDPQLVEYCKTADCRTDLMFTLRLQSGMILGYSPSLAPPVIYDGSIIIYPGDELFIEAEMGETGPINLKLVEEKLNPEKTFTFKFEQINDYGDGTYMMMGVTNPFDKMLKYQAFMVLPGDGNAHETSSCPVMPGIIGFESWPQPIFQLFLTDLKFVEPTDSIVCE